MAKETEKSQKTEKLYTSYIFHCKTSVHAGDGTSTGTIDMPIQKEKPTSFPVFRDSTTRGAVREYFETPLVEKIKSGEAREFTATFGNKDNGDVASALDVLPSKLLFFPVRSIKGIFAYVTCPFILNRFVKEMKLFHGKEIKLTLPELVKETCYATKELLVNENYLGLEEFGFKLTDKAEAFDIGEVLKLINTTEISRLTDHYAIIDDTSFAYFTRLFTDKTTRNKIDIETGVASDSGLFNEEFLPEESILYTTFGFANEFSKEEGRKTAMEIQEYFEENFDATSIFQLGGDKSIGKGLISPFKIDFNTEKSE